MNRKNNIKKITAAAIAVVSLTLPFSSVCADGSNDSVTNKVGESCCSRPESSVLADQSKPEISAVCPRAPRKSTQNSRRRLTNADIRNLRDYSRRIQRAFVTGDENKMDALLSIVHAHQDQKKLVIYNLIRSNNSSSKRK